MGWSAPQTLQGWIALGTYMGLNPANYAPSQFWNAANASVVKNLHSASSTPPPAQIAQAQSMLIVRGLIYQKKSPGDCGTYTTLDFGNVDLTEGAGKAASGILSGLSQVSSGIASFAGAALPGIGIAVQAITQIFANHAAAVADEQTTLCHVAAVINQVIPYYDAQVKSGAIDPSTAYTGVQQFIAQVNAALQQIYKSCNAACVYMSILAAHADFLTTYYPAIAPRQIAPNKPGAAPSSIITTAPGGVPQVGNTLGVGSTAALVQGNIPADAQPAQSGPGVIIGIVAAIILLILVLAG